MRRRDLSVETSLFGAARFDLGAGASDLVLGGIPLVLELVQLAPAATDLLACRGQLRLFARTCIAKHLELANPAL